MLYKSFFASMLLASIAACPIKDAQNAAANDAGDDNLAQVRTTCPCNDSANDESEQDGNLAQVRTKSSV